MKYKVIWEMKHEIEIEANSAKEAEEIVGAGDFDERQVEFSEITMKPEAYEIK